MDHPVEIRCMSIQHRAWLARAACAVLLWACMAGAHAASIYKCVDAQGHLTFRDTPCATHARQTKLAITGQPLIDPSAPRRTASVEARKHSSARSRHVRATRARTRQRKQPMSWECHAADGEVFYRHTRCPGSIPGDGVVRDQWRDDGSERTPRRRRNTWSRVPVHGKKIPRDEACRRIHAAGAAGRDGHQRDASVSTYDHLMGRDPCAAA